MEISNETVIPTREQIAEGVRAQLITDPMEYSREGASKLARNVLAGMTDRHGFPWWAGAWQESMGESPFYRHGIPLQVVKDRLFDFTVEEHPLFDVDLFHVDEDGHKEPLSYRDVPGWKALRHSTTKEVLHVAQQGYLPHQFGEILCDGMSTIVGDTLYVSSAGVLKGGRVGWLQIETDTLEHRSGVVIRPFALISTSHDASYATQAQESSTNTRCDNSHRRSLGEDVPRWKMRHTSQSRLTDEQIAKAREALGLMLERENDAWLIELDLLTRDPVTDRQYEEFVNVVAPLVDEKGKELEGRSRTMARNKQGELLTLWRKDQRVAPWAGTSWGVVQAWNTWSTHFQTVRGGTRLERQMLRALDGDTGDGYALTKLDLVTGGRVTELRKAAILQQRERKITVGAR